MVPRASVRPSDPAHADTSREVCPYWMLFLLRSAANRGVFAVLLIAAAVASASTLTRTTYIEFLVSIAAVVIIPLLLREGWSNRFVVSASVGFSVLAYGAIVAFFLLTRLQS